MWNRKVFIRIIELLLCIACVVTLRVTDDESRRVWHYLRNRSREWFLLNNVTWGTIGAALATATCGGYTIVSAGLLLAAATGELKGRVTEKCLLGLGIILFGVIGALSLFSIQNVPDDLVDNAIIFGVLCLATVVVFIIDFLMSSPSSGKKKHDGTQTISSKEQAKQYVTTTTMTINNEKEQPRSVTTTWRSPTPEMTEKRHSVDDPMVPDRDDADDDDDRGRKFERMERQTREYTHQVDGFRNGRSKHMRDRDEMPQKLNGYYRRDDTYQRPVDEVDDVPPFPTNGEIFTKVNHPNVKIMRVERDEDRGYDNYRYSDTSQYDNVPTRLRGSSPGTSRRRRDGYSGDQPRSRGSRPHQAPSARDEIEMLEGYFDALKTSTTSASAATQTQSAAATDRLGPRPARGAGLTPNDPGFVRHTASNWPHTAKTNADSPPRT